jgi:hypothetical protein
MRRLPGIRIRKLPQQGPNSAKFFGYPEDKWARGGGNKGYARAYGHRSGGPVDGRTRTEHQNAIDRREAENGEMQGG